MSEKLRDTIDNPEKFWEMGQKHGQRSHKLLEERAEPQLNVATKYHQGVAYDVAYAVKDDIDFVTTLKNAKELHEETAAGATGPNGKLALVAPAFAKQAELLGTQADLESNAREVTLAAMQSNLGHNAIALIQHAQANYDK